MPERFRRLAAGRLVAAILKVCGCDSHNSIYNGENDLIVRRVLHLFLLCRDSKLTYASKKEVVSATAIITDDRLFCLVPPKERDAYICRKAGFVWVLG